ncbi:MAG: 4a-hydroxytetrahydrobiopterin dehydratase [Actinomycetes bacterium]
MTRLLTEEEIDRQLEGLGPWRHDEGEPAITATFEFTDFAAALDFVTLVGHEAEQMNHHPDIDIRWNRVTLTLSTHSAGGLTQLDIELAHRISTAAGLDF